MKPNLRHPIRFIIYLILFAASVVWISFEGGMLPYLTFFALLLQYPLFIAYMIYVNQSLKIHQETPVRQFKKNEAQDFLLVLENSGFLPVGALYLKEEDKASKLIKKGAGKDSKIPEDTQKAEKMSFTIMPGKRCEMKMKLVCFYAGTYPVGVLSFTITDPFGIFAASFEVPQKYRAIVRPDVSDEEGWRIAKTLPSDEARFQNKNSADDILGTELKKYSQGDRKSAVHWKLYAKTGELYTRLPENKNVGMFTVLLCSERIREESIGDTIMRDAFLTRAVSFAYYFAKQEKPVEIIFCQGDWKSFIIESYKTFEAFFSEITKGIYFGGAGEDCAALYKEKERSLKASGKRVFVIYEKDGD